MDNEGSKEKKQGYETQPTPQKDTNNNYNTCNYFNIGNMLNYFPTKVGVSTTLVTRDILNEENLDYKKSCMIALWAVLSDS